MPYIYSKKSFARDLFDAAKAKLQKPMPKFIDRAAQWPGIINYGIYRPLLSYWVQFRSAQGSRLHTNSVPLCSYAPEFIANQSRKNSTPPPQADLDAEFAERVAAMKAAEAFGNGLSLDKPSGALGLSSENDDGAEPEEAQAPVSSSRKIPIAVISTLLSVAAAIAAGVIVANSNSFKFRHAAANRVPPAEVLAQKDETAAGESSATRLAMEPTLPQPSRLFPAASESRPKSSPKLEKKNETRTTRVQAAEKKLRKEDVESRPPRRLATAEPAVKPKKTAQSSELNRSRSNPTATAKTDRVIHARQSGASPGTQYARCDNVKGLLRRERCKWNACGGKWGKQGCPAYQHNARPELGPGQLGQLGQSSPAASSLVHDGG